MVSSGSSPFAAAIRNQANPEKLARISRHWAESEREAPLLSSW